MGYTTDFTGSFKLDKPLSEPHKEYLNRFSYSRRMKRNAAKADKLDDPIRLAAGLPIGKEGAFYVGNKLGADVLDYNKPPSGQPGLWCQWVPNHDGTRIEWDEGEKFYNYVEWIAYIIEHFLEPWGYVLNGEAEWRGEDTGDLGQIVVKENVVSAKNGSVVYK